MTFRCRRRTESRSNVVSGDGAEGRSDVDEEVGHVRFCLTERDGEAVDD